MTDPQKVEKVSNPFQWESLMLNLPGSAEYKPSLPWVMQLRADNSVTSGMTCFVDDDKRVCEAGQAISSREKFL